MDYNYLLVENKDGVAILRLNNPKSRNPLNLDTRAELLHALQQAASDEEIRSIIITGEGKAFSAGGDLGGFKKVELMEGKKRMQNWATFVQTMLDIEKPVIAAVNGPAAGAGFSFSLLCDFIVASDQAFFVSSFSNIGLIPDLGSMHFLPLLIGPHKAKELMFLGDRISADEAHRIGMVTRVVPHDNLISETLNIAEILSKKSPVSIGISKKIMNKHINREIAAFLEMESYGQAICFQSEDFKEGVNAFFEKREPKFPGK